MGFGGDVICVRPDTSPTRFLPSYMSDLESRIAEANATRDTLQTKVTDLTTIKNTHVDPETRKLAEAILLILNMFGVD